MVATDEAGVVDVADDARQAGEVSWRDADGRHGDPAHVTAHLWPRQQQLGGQRLHRTHQSDNNNNNNNNDNNNNNNNNNNGNNSDYLLLHSTGIQICPRLTKRVIM